MTLNSQSRKIVIVSTKCFWLQFHPLRYILPVSFAKRQMLCAFQNSDLESKLVMKTREGKENFKKWPNLFMFASSVAGCQVSNFISSRYTFSFSAKCSHLQCAGEQFFWRTFETPSPKCISFVGKRTTCYFMSNYIILTKISI